MRHIILGTAGHIDHGKSTLVKALTGIDPDRLKEEKERGITIDLGFADLKFDDLVVGIVDVPGHERLVKNMLAGAAGIDMVLLTIAADESVMPQSREHLAICNLLGIKDGIVVLTKSDLVDEEWLELALDDAKDFVKGSFLENAEIIPVSSKTGENIDVLREKIKSTANKVKEKTVGGLFRLPVDRVFSLKGFGTVVTGTVVAGAVSLDSSIEILPSGLKGKVRGLHSHGMAQESARAGQRTAINIQGIEKDEIRRGDIVAEPGRFLVTDKIDVSLSLLQDSPPVKNRSTIHFHGGTSETTARVIIYGLDMEEKNRQEIKGGERAYCQLRLSRKIVAMSGDRFIIRRFSPVETIGGGLVLDPSPKRRRKKDGLSDLVIYNRGSLKEMIYEKINAAGIEGITAKSIEGWKNEELKVIHGIIESLSVKGKIADIQGMLFSSSIIDFLKSDITLRVKEFHKNFPVRVGITREELKTHFKGLDRKIFINLLSEIDELVTEKEIVRLKSFKAALTDIDKVIRQKLISALDKAGCQPPLKNELAKNLSINEKEMEDILKLLAKEDALIRINDSLYLLKEHYNIIIDKIKAFSKTNSEITVAEFRDMIGTSRKYALPFLEYMDSKRITIRVGDKRKIL